MKLVDLGEPTSFLDHVYMGCTQHERKSNENVVCQHREMFESRISGAAIEKLPGWENLTQKQYRGPTTWKDMRKNVLKDCELANKKTEQLFKVSTPCMDDHREGKVGNGWRIDQCVFSNCLEMLVFGTNW